ncbi:hypothetical protein D9756_000645 [Leucocoprinus leucothites]|uniref:UBC core domain-containing protein n=1 Tax=Leucocoprinus leucothites TaxID=201217 RepID=A0A8H5GF21_9AGAR|nr:hypothetical protein D9756_000645 [Leucoagaricus leucothites]
MLGSFVANPLLATQSRTSKGTNNSLTATSTINPSKADAPSIVARTALSLEYASLRHADHCPLGIYVVPSPENLFVWDAVLFVHQGYYAGAVLRFRLNFPSDYPDRIPTVQFVTDIFHPLIDQGGYFNLSSHFRPWKPKEHHVYNILYDIKAAFKKYRLDQIKEADAWNKEAYRYHESTSSFSALATQSSQLTRSESALFDKDHPSFAGRVTEGLGFQKLSSEKLREYRQRLGLREWADEPSEL